MAVIIIGAGPVGAYTAKIIGEAGIKVKVYEKDAKDKVKINVNIIHFDVQDYIPLGLDPTSKSHSFYIDTFEKMWQVALDDSKKFAIDYPTDILYMNGFIQSIVKQAEKSGNVEFFYECPFEKIIVEGSAVVGAVIGGGIGEVRSDLLIDCSGMEAVVRNSLPLECIVDKLKARDGRIFTLHMEHWICKSEFPQGSNTYCCYKGFANQVAPQETLIGVSTLKGLEHTKNFHKEMKKAQKLDLIDHEIKAVLGGRVPYDFPPASLVGDGFLSIGDSAFQNKPFNGEGMASGMKAAQLALPSIKKAIETKNYSRKTLWGYNVSFFRGFGSDFALIRGTGETLVELTPEEFNWMFENGFIDQKMMESTWKTYKAKTGPKIIVTGLKGLKNGKLFRKILGGIALGGKLQKHYKKYPKSPEGLAQWKEKFHKILNS